MDRDAKGRFIVGHRHRHSEETKARIRLASLAQQSISRLHTPEVRARAVATRLSRPHPAWNKGRPWSIERRRKLSEAAKPRGMERLHNEENRAKAAKANRDNGTLKAKWVNDQIFRSRLLEHLKELNHNPEVRARRTAALKERYDSDPDLRERNRKHLEKARAQSNRRPNKPETHLQQVLDAEYPHQWQYTGDGKLIIGGYNPDFANCNGKKLLIELFGDYWHTKKADKWSDTELGRVMAFNSLGFRCLVIWEHELGHREQVVEKINHFMGDPNG